MTVVFIASHPEDTASIKGIFTAEGGPSVTVVFIASHPENTASMTIIVTAL